MQHRDRLSDEERKARRKASAATYREANREKCVAASLKSRAKKPEAYREMNRLIRERNADHITAQQRQYREANRDAINARGRAWQIANAESYRAYQKAYAAAHPNAAKLRVKKWRQMNKEHAAAYSARWAREHRDLKVLKEQRRRHRVMINGGALPKDIIKQLMQLQRGMCPVCRADLSFSGHHLDHIMPLARGGQHAKGNVQLLCPSCNVKKHAKHPVDFMQERGFLL